MPKDKFDLYVENLQKIILEEEIKELRKPFERFDMMDL